jgi:hypothetical protein
VKALPIYPEFPDTFWSFRYALKFINRKASSPPLGLLTVAAMLPEAWDIKLVDMNVESLYDDDLRWAELVLVGAMSVQKESVKTVVGRVERSETRHDVSWRSCFSRQCLEEFRERHTKQPTFIKVSKQSGNIGIGDFRSEMMELLSNLLLW